MVQSHAYAGSTACCNVCAIICTDTLCFAQNMDIQDNCGHMHGHLSRYIACLQCIHMSMQSHIYKWMIAQVNDPVAPTTTLSMTALHCTDTF